MLSRLAPGKRIYISNFSGVGNRLEALVLGSLIEDRHGVGLRIRGRLPGAQRV